MSTRGFCKLPIWGTGRFGDATVFLIGIKVKQMGNLLFNNKNVFYFVLAGILILVLVYVLSNRNQDLDTQEEGGSQQAHQQNAASGNEPLVIPVDTKGTGYAEKRAQQKQEKLDALQALLDDEEKHGEALKLALSMADTGDDEQKNAAIETFNWIGGHEAKVALVKLLDTGGSVTENATSALIHLFQEDAQKQEEPFDEEAFVAALDKLVDADRDALFIVLSGYPVETAAPVLIKLMDTQNKAVREQVFETFESIAEGMTIANKADAEKWFKNYLAENIEE